MAFSVAPCSRLAALEILQDKSVSVPWGIYVDDVLDVSGLYLIDGKVLMQLIPDGYTAEVHIACKYRDRKGARGSLINALNWLKRVGFSKIVTNAPEDRMALQSMLRSLGFQRIDKRWIYGHGSGNNGGDLGRG